MTAPDIVTEARQLLDAATPGPWVHPSPTANWFTTPDPIDIDEADWGPEAQERGLRGYRIGTLADERAWRYADVELIAAAPRLVTDLVAEVERLRGQHDEHEKVVDWADDALARRDARITELIAERDAALAKVEGLRHELDQRTDPELARALNNLAATYDGSMYLVNAAADLRAAARLLGGDQ